MGGGGSSSSSSTDSTTLNTDKRLVVSDSGLGISSDTSTVTVHQTTLDPEIIKASLDMVSGADARQGDSLDKIIGLAGSLFTGGFKALESSQSQVNQAYQQATETKQAAGTIDNRTIMILGVAGAAAVAYMARGK